MNSRYEQILLSRSLIVISAIICIDGGSNAQDLVGVYKHTTDRYITTVITLRKDSTFVYMAHAGISSGSIKVTGIWHKSNQQVILNSHDQPLVAQSEGNCDSLNIKVVDDADQPIIFAFVEVKSGLKSISGISTDFEGKAAIDVTDGDSLIISRTGYSPVRYHVGKKICHMKFRLYDGSQKYFTNEVFIIQNGAICREYPQPYQSKCLKKID